MQLLLHGTCQPPHETKNLVHLYEDIYENLSKVTLVYGTIHLMISSSQSWDNLSHALHLLYLQLSLLRQRGLNLRHGTFTHLSIIFFDM